MNDFDTPVDMTVTAYPSPDAWANMQRENVSLTERLHNVQAAKDFADRRTSELSQKIKNVEGVIRDYYSENGEMLEELETIASLLDIALTKRISGTADFSISWSAEVPLGFDPDDFEISFDVDCDTYDADNFDWQEENTEVHAEED